MFAKETYIGRRQKLKKTVGSGIILLLGNNESPMNFTDNTFHFRQDSTFLYFFGINLPNLVATIDCDSGEIKLFGTNPTIEDSVWAGPHPTIENQGLQIGVSLTGSLNEFVTHIKKQTNGDRKIHFLPQR